MDMFITPEMREKGVDDHSLLVLLNHGRRKGFLTPGDIVDCIPYVQWDEELLDLVNRVIVDAGIPFLEVEEEIEGPGEADFAEGEVDTEAFPIPLSAEMEGEDVEPGDNPDEGDDSITTPLVEQVRDEEESRVVDIDALDDDENLEAAFENVASDDMVGMYLKEAARVPLLKAEEEVALAKRIERGTKAKQELSLGRLNHERRVELNRQIESGKQAREHLIRANTRLVVSVAKKYMNRGLPLLDLIQEGNIGLMRAIRHYDYTRGFKFSTYATWWIRQAVTRSLAEQSRTIRLPVHMSDAVNRMLREQTRLQQELGRKPKADELSQALDVTVEKVEQMMKIVRQPISLQTPVGEDEEEMLGDFIEDVSAPDPEESVAQVLMNEDLRKRLDTLPERELQVLQLRYGLEGAEPMTLNQIGQQMGITRERARQLEAQALQRLRSANGEEQPKARRGRKRKQLDEE
jgi:RNA polymerase primary sigma factor